MVTKTGKVGVVRSPKNVNNGYILAEIMIMARKVGKNLFYFAFGVGPYRNSKTGGNRMHGRLSPKLASVDEVNKWLRKQFSDGALHKGEILPGHNRGGDKCKYCVYTMHGTISFAEARGEKSSAPRKAKVSTVPVKTEAPPAV